MPGRPLSPRFFGANGISVTFNIDGIIRDGYIVRQLGTYKYIVTSDGVNFYPVKIAQTNAEAVNLPLDTCRIQAVSPNGEVTFVRHLSQNLMQSTSGAVYNWVLNADTDGKTAAIPRPSDLPPPIIPPTITSNSNVNVNENATLAHTLSANESVFWEIAGGADANLFEISGSTLRWFNNTTRDYEAPVDAGANNVYNLTIRATSLNTNLSVTVAHVVTVFNIADGGAPVAPTITSNATLSNPENSVLAHTLTADQTVTWSLVGGADQAQFEISGSTLRWASNGTRNFESPADVALNNTYIVQVRATNGTSGLTATQTISVTVTDVAEAAYDYTITNDADWATVLAIPAATLSGKRVGIQPGTYTKKTITVTGHANNITFEAISGTPRIDRIVLNNTGKLIFKGLEIVSSGWPASDSSQNIEPCVRYAGSVGYVEFNTCKFKGNYRGNVDATIDVNTNSYPEYACIKAETTGGVITGLTITRPNVGDLLADGVYPLIFTQGTGAAGTMTVSGGQIVSTNLTAGGSGYPSSGLTNVVSWTGQRKFVLYAPMAMQSQTRTGEGSQDIQGPLSVHECEFKNLCAGIKTTAMAGGTIENNIFDTTYGDVLSFGVGSGATVPGKYTVRWNYFTNPFSAEGDPGDPHSDYVQFFMNDITPPYSAGDWEVDIYGNVAVAGNSRGQFQGMLFGDSPLSTQAAFSGRIMGNLMLTRRHTLGIQVDGARNLFVYGNTVVRYNTTDATNESPLNFRMGLTDVYENVFIGSNVYEGEIGLDDPFINKQSFPNVILGVNGATIPYGNVFANPNSNPTNLAAAVAAYQTIGTHTAKGAARADNYVDFVAREIDLTKEPTVVAFTNTSGVATSSTQTSNWSKVLSGPATSTVSISGGTYSIADNASGLNATAFTGVSGTVARGKYIQVRHTASATGATSVTTTLTLGSTPWTFTSTTQSVASFTTVDNNATSYSYISSPSSDTNIQKVLIGFRMKADAWTANANIVAGVAGGGLRIYAPTTSSLRMTFVNTSACQYRPGYTTDLNAHTHLISIDFTQANAAAGLKWVIDGSLMSQSTGTAFTSGTNASLATALTSALGLMAAGDGSGVILNGRFDYFWMDWGTSSYTMPDITTSLVQNKFTADLIGANGNGPTGLQPKLYYTGTASEWNAGLANKGSLVKTLTKGGTGSYT